MNLGRFMLSTIKYFLLPSLVSLAVTYYTDHHLQKNVNVKVDISVLIVLPASDRRKKE